MKHVAIHDHVTGIQNIVRAADDARHPIEHLTCMLVAVNKLNTSIVRAIEVHRIDKNGCDACGSTTNTLSSICGVCWNDHCKPKGYDKLLQEATRVLTVEDPDFTELRAAVAATGETGS